MQNDFEPERLIYPFLTYFWVVGVAIWGGAAAFIYKVRSTKMDRSWFFEFVGDAVISGFIGFITLNLCAYSHVDIRLTVVYAAIAGHMGTRAIALFEKFLIRKINPEYKQDAS